MQIAEGGRQRSDDELVWNQLVQLFAPVLRFLHRAAHDRQQAWHHQRRVRRPAILGELALHAVVEGNGGVTRALLRVDQLAVFGGEVLSCPGRPRPVRSPDSPAAGERR